jgi:hypothetical protein
MEDLPNSGPVVEPVASPIEEQYNSLRQLVTSMLILMIVVSGTLNIYLLRQWRSTSKDLNNYRPFAANVITSYQKGDGAAVEAFVRNVAEYGRTHPDFAPILAKYNIRPGTFNPPVSGPATSSPTAAPAPKK